MMNQNLNIEPNSPLNMKDKLDTLEKEYSYINELIAANLKTFDVHIK